MICSSDIKFSIQRKCFSLKLLYFVILISGFVFPKKIFSRDRKMMSPSTNAGVARDPGIFIPGDRDKSGRFTEPPCQQEQHETAEMAAVGFPDSSAQVFYDSLHDRLLEVAQERGSAPGGSSVFVLAGILGSFHRLVLLSVSALHCLTKIYARKGRITI
jgi:hypothetical protein